MYLGTTNKNKVKEFSFLTGIDFKSLHNAFDVEETEDTLEGNAILKATTYAKMLDDIVVSEDSGLFVPSLGGAPGVYSARFYQRYNITLTESRDDVNNSLLLQLLEGKDRTAYYKSVIAVADKYGVLFRCSGTVHGTIANTLRGNNGFAYDPLFICELGKTFGELDFETKNLVSHRSQSIEKFMAWYKNIYWTL